jgi:hypothetical protein
MMLEGPGALHQVALELLDAAAVALDRSPGGRPGRACVVPGAIAWDDCTCEGGQLAVALTRTYRSAAFPTEGAGPEPCAAGFLAAAFVVQVIRCAPQPEGQATAPSCEALAASAAVVTTDAWLVRQGVHCRLVELDEAEEVEAYQLAGQPVLGPAGGCVGCELAVVVALPDVCCPEGS